MRRELLAFLLPLPGVQQTVVGLDWSRVRGAAECAPALRQGARTGRDP
jgi:hypothetical protein